MLPCLALLSLAAALVQAQATPKNDPFYAKPAPGSLAAFDYGHILDYRNNIDAIRTAFKPTTPTVQNSWQIKFVTNDTTGAKVAAVTTLIQPNNARNGYLVSYQPPYDTSNLDCSPSYLLTIREHGNVTQALNYDEYVVGQALNQGYWVNVPDFEGLNAAFGSGPTAGYTLLDSLRAVLSSNSVFQTGLSATPTIGLIGYSGGGFAAEFASELQPRYAPSLNNLIAAIVIGGPPVDISTTLANVNGLAMSVFLIPNALQGLANIYPAFARYLYGLSAKMPLATQQAFNYSLNSCNDGTHYYNQDIYGMYLGTTAAKFLASPQFQTVLKAGGIMGRIGHPTHPMYIFQGANDKVVSPQRTTALVNQYCGSNFGSVSPATVARTNISIQYVLDGRSGADHAGEAVLGIKAAFAFLVQQMNNPAPTTLTGCSFTTITR